MEVIVRGIAPADRVYECSCRKCNTIFRFNQSEGVLMTDSRDGDYLEVKCPVCRTAINVDVRNYKR